MFDSAQALRTLLEGDTEGAVRRARPLRANLDLAVARARREQRFGDEAKARRMYRKCVRMDPRDGRAYLALSRLEGRRRRPKFGGRDGDQAVDQATQRARKWLEDGCAACGGSNAHLWQAWGVLEGREGAVARARQYYEAALAADEAHAPAWHALGKLEERQGDKARAMELYRTGIKRCAPNEWLQQSLAMLEWEAGRPDQARMHFRGAVALDAGSAPTYTAWARMEGELGDREEQGRILQDGLDASPKNRYLWLDIGVWEEQHGRGAAVAREHLRTGAELNPRDGSLRQALALLEARQGNAQRARAWFKKAVVADAYHIPSWLSWGVFEWRRGDEQRARELFRRGLLGNAKREGAARILHAWGALEWRSAGNVTVAREFFKAALRIDSRSMTLWDTWLALEMDTGDQSGVAEVSAARTQTRSEAAMASEDLRLQSLLAPTLVEAGGAEAPAADSVLQRLVVWAASQSRAANDAGALDKRIALAVQPIAAGVAAGIGEHLSGGSGSA